MNSFQSTQIKNIKPNSNWFFALLGILGNILWIGILAVLLLRIFVYQQVQVDGLSMFPNYDNKQYLLVNQLDKTFRRGQVVAVFANRDFAEKVAFEMNPIQAYLARFDCTSPASRTEDGCRAKFYLKRIVGLPGEEIEIVGGNVVIYNTSYPEGTLITEDYLPQSTVLSENSRNFYYPRTKIPNDEYFVMGDNRSNSMDSRKVGSFPYFSIFGQENFRILPIDSFHVFEIPTYEYRSVPNSLKLRAEEYQATLRQTLN
jgi:signal peptidase I